MKSNILILFFIVTSINLIAQQYSTRIYKGVEITDTDIEYYQTELLRWVKDNTTLSSDFNKMNNCVTLIVNELKKGHVPSVTSNGAIIIGNYKTPAGKRGTFGTDFNLFGNISDEVGVTADKTIEYFDKLIEAKKSQITSTTPTTPTQKYHSDLSKTISDRYFGGNWQNAQKGIKYWDAETRRNRARQGIIDAIVLYKEEYGEDSPYISKLSQLSNPKISTNEIIEIAFSMGMDPTWIFE